MVQTAGSDPTTVTVAAGSDADAGVDGYQPQGTISGHVFADLDGNGTQDVGEPNLINIDVVITDSLGNSQTVSTDLLGNYTATVPVGSTTANVDESDPDMLPGATLTTANDPQTVTVLAGANTPTTSVGYRSVGSISGHVFLDDNGNGIQDIGEIDLANIDVIITDSLGGTQTVSTDVQGNYLAVVPAGSTTANVDESDPDMPVGAALTTANDPQTVSVAPNVTTPTAPVGYDLWTAQLSGTIFQDDDLNGVFAAGTETVYENVTVTLLWAGLNGAFGDGDDQVIGAQPTDAAGLFNFPNLPSGNFQVSIDETLIPSNRVLINTTNPFQVTLADGENSTGNDAGYGAVGFAKSDAILWSDVDNSSTVSVGDVLAFEIDIVNPSQINPMTIDVEDSLPSGLSGLNILADAGGDVSASTPLFLSVADINLAALSAKTITFTVSINSDVVNGTNITNTATGDIDGDGSDDVTDDGVTGPIDNILPPTPVEDICSETYIVQTEVGDGLGGYQGDGGAATAAEVYFPTQVCVDADNNLFIADYSNHIVRRVDAITGVITTVAGIPQSAGYTGDGGLAASAQLRLPSDVFVRGTDLYIAELGNSVIRKVDMLTGIISTVAGTGVAGFSGDGGPALSAQLNQPRTVFVDVAGNIYIGDTFNFALRKVDAATGIIDTILGQPPTPGHGIDGDLAVDSYLEWIHDIQMDSNGVLHFTEQNGYNLIRRITESGVLETVAGKQGTGDWGDCGPALYADLRKPYAIAFDSLDNLYVTDEFNHRLRKIDHATGYINSIVGTGVAGFNGDGLPGVLTDLNHPTGVVWATDGRLHFVDRYNQRVREIDTTNPVDLGLPQFPNSPLGTLSQAAGTGVAGFNGDGFDAREQMLSYPGRIAFDGANNLIIADRSNHRVRRVFRNWSMTTLAGTWTRGYSGDGGQSRSAEMNFPSDVAVGADGSIYVADEANNVIRRIAPDGIISTVMTGLNAPNGLAFAGDYLYVSDTGNGMVLALQISNGQITTQAVGMLSPRGLDIDPLDGSIVVAEQGRHQIVRIRSGLKEVIAGNGVATFVGDGGAAIDASLNQPMDVAVADDGTIYVADYRNHRVRVIVGGIINTLVGTGTPGTDAGNVPVSSAQLNYPVGVALDGAGYLYISDRMNSTIKAMVP